MDSLKYTNIKILNIKFLLLTMSYSKKTWRENSRAKETKENRCTDQVIRYIFTTHRRKPETDYIIFILLLSYVETKQ